MSKFKPRFKVTLQLEQSDRGKWRVVITTTDPVYVNLYNRASPTEYYRRIGSGPDHQWEGGTGTAIHLLAEGIADLLNNMVQAHLDLVDDARAEGGEQS